MSSLLSFHRILPGCEEGQPEAWKAFLADYSPLALQLLGVYLPSSFESHEALWRQALVALSVDHFAALRQLEHQAEREFLVGLRAFLLDRALTSLEPSQDSATPPPPTVESLAGLLKGLPLLHQEILFLTLAGYSLATLERILRISPAVAQQGLERLKKEYAAVLERSQDRCLWPAAWLAVTRSARAAKGQDCASLRQLVRILDGQASWYDKSPVEDHRSSCLYCLELWTSLLEVAAFRRDAKRWPPEKIQPFLKCLPLREDSKQKQPFFARLFKK